MYQTVPSTSAAKQLVGAEERRLNGPAQPFETAAEVAWLSLTAVPTGSLRSVARRAQRTHRAGTTRWRVDGHAHARVSSLVGGRRSRQPHWRASAHVRPDAAPH